MNGLTSQVSWQFSERGSTPIGETWLVADLPERPPGPNAQHLAQAVGKAGRSMAYCTRQARFHQVTNAINILFVTVNTRYQ
jgi:hypothetical protein